MSTDKPDAYTAPREHKRCSGFEIEPVADWSYDNRHAGSGATTDGPGVGVGDLNNDGWLDVVVAMQGKSSQVYLNDGTGSLAPHGSWLLHGEPLGDATAVTLVDIDGDGWLDAYLSRPYGLRDEILYNNGGSGFGRTQQIPNTLGASKTVSFADADGDGDLDFFTAGFQQDLSVLTGNALYLQDEDGGFVDVRERLPTDVLGSLSYQAGWADVDDDGDLDIYLVNDHGAEVTSNRLLLNDGTAHFTTETDCGCEVAIAGMGVTVGDPNDDGRPDFYMTNWGPGVYLQNLGNGSFVDSTLAAGLKPETNVDQFTWGSLFVDLDQDGWEDMVAVSSTMSSRHEQSPGNLLFHGQPNGTFEELTNQTGFQEKREGRSVVAGDLDRDGFPDLITVGWPYVQVWSTQSECRPGVTVSLEGPRGNTAGIGATARVKVGDRVYTRWMLPATTYSSSAAEWYFGLDNALQADWVEVTWPDGEISFLDNPTSGSRHVLKHPSLD